MASHEMSMIEVAGCDRFRLEIYGTEGTIWLRSERGPLALFASRRLGREGWETPALPQPPFGQRQHQRWLDGLAGAAPRESSTADALHGMLVAEAIQRSAASDGRREPVRAS
jgi:predicted dehydrogenase